MFKPIKTVDSILSSFTSMVADLEAVAQTQTEKAEKLNEQILSLECDKETAVDEAERALKVASNIKSLVNNVIG